MLKPAECHKEYECHNQNEARNGRESPRKNAVRGNRALMFAAFMRAHYRGGAQALDEREPHIGHRGFTIEPAVTFERVYELIQRGIFRRGKRKRALDK